MIFSEPAYFAGVAVAAIAFRFLPVRAKPWWLFATGLLFYWYFSPSFAGILGAEVAFVYVLARCAGAPRSRPLTRGATLGLGLALTIGLLAVYKYGELIVSTAAGLIGTANPPAAGLSTAGRTGATLATSTLPGVEDARVPLAISFFTFEFVHYLVESRRCTLPRHGVGDFLGFAFFAPTLVAGPIKRFGGFAEQAREARATATDVSAGITRVLVGLVKKTVLADTLSLWAGLLASDDAVGYATRGEIAVALLAYSLRIYFDFSGYSDIAIGSARLFGIRVPENFAWPYLAGSIAEFWRRWHISLMRWIRDYVYIPLGGSRCPTWRQAFNLLAAFAVSGLWHGAEWHFVAWGLYHGALVAAHRIWTRELRPRLAKSRSRPAGAGQEAGVTAGEPEAGKQAPATGIVGRVAGTLATFSLVTLGWGLFVMPLDRFWLMLQRFTFGGM